MTSVFWYETHLFPTFTLFISEISLLDHCCWSWAVFVRSACEQLKPLTPENWSHARRTRPKTPQLIIGFYTGANLTFTLAKVRALFPCFSAGSVSYDWLKLIPVYMQTPTWQLLSRHVGIKLKLKQFCLHLCKWSTWVTVSLSSRSFHPGWFRNIYEQYRKTVSRLIRWKQKHSHLLADSARLSCFLRYAVAIHCNSIIKSHRFYLVL